MGSPVFISYSHRDKKWIPILESYLRPLVSEMNIIPWHDGLIPVGTDWRKELRKRLAAAKVAVLLVSQDFINSDFINMHELPNILEAANRETLTICWIPIRPSTYRNTPLERFQALGDPGRPLAGLSKGKREEELVTICGQIARALEERKEGQDNPQTDSDSVDSTSHSAGEGIRALIELIGDPLVRERVGGFKAVFGATCKQIEILAFYKGLHDILHNLQFQCYNYLSVFVRTLKNDPDDASVWDDMIQHELTLSNIVRDLQEAAANKELAEKVGWIPGLLEDLERLFQAVRTTDAEALGPAVRPIGRILANQPVILDSRLGEAARAVPLPSLVNALTGVCETLDRRRINEATMRRFQGGVRALSELDASLSHLTNDHTRWQEIDVEIRLMDGLLGQDLDELKSLWPALKRLTSIRYQDSQEDWAVALAEETAKLDAAIESGDQRAIRQFFHRFKTRVNSRFYYVDFTLNGLCDKMRRVGGPLSDLWDTLNENGDAS